MWQRIKPHWLEVRPNVKFWILGLVATALWLAFTAFADGIPRWRQIALSGLLIFAITWAVAATVAASRVDNTTTPRTQPPQPTAESPNSLQLRIWQLCRDLRKFLKEVGPKPDPPMRDDGEDAAEFIQRRWNANGPWMDKLVNGFELRFRNRVTTIMHELGERSIYRSAVAQVLERETMSTAEPIQEIIEGLAIMAAKLDEN
jgi:hypothetical protein